MSSAAGTPMGNPQVIPYATPDPPRPPRGLRWLWATLVAVAGVDVAAMGGGAFEVAAFAFLANILLAAGGGIGLAVGALRGRVRWQAVGIFCGIMAFLLFAFWTFLTAHVPRA